VHKVNDQFLKIVEGEKDLFTAGTLHPFYPSVSEELESLSSRGIRAIKFSSFSQRFDLESRETFGMFEKIRAHNIDGKPPFFVVFDTFCQADAYFGTPREYLTTPEKLGRLVAAFPEIDFIAAHMGGLAGSFRDIEMHLPPQKNLYLDTSNASHVLSRHEFVQLLELHGPDRVLFGTDWPWFGHREEVPRIVELLQEAGFSSGDESAVLSGNICRLLGKDY
jgi:predicted TIM-barrel fold metal-dependent hydrolase